MIANVYKEKIRVTDGDYVVGVKSRDSYDKTRYHWDPQLKKVVYIKKGTSTRENAHPAILNRLAGRTLSDVFNGKQDATSELPREVDTKINERNIPQNMRPKEIYIESEGNKIVVKTITQESYNRNDFNKYAKEIERAFTKRNEKIGGRYKFDIEFMAYPRGEGNWHDRYDAKTIKINY